MTFKNKMKLSAGSLAALSLTFIGMNAAADQVILDDLIVDGSACIGQDCVNGESFGFDTLRLKENNLRINFADTSVSASFPTNDWRIVANDSANGGSNYLAIEDATAARQIFRVDAGAPASSLYVDSSGDVGVGTNNPVVELHVVDGDSPTLRLEQNGSSGFTPQTFDMAANEANFFIRDVTNGSQLPFRIEPGADSDSIYIEDTNDVGIGTSSPTASLHVRRTNKSAAIRVEDASSTNGAQEMLQLVNTGNPQIALQNENNDNRWQIGGGTRLVIKHFATTDAAFTGSGGTTPFTLENDGDLIITGSITTGGTMCGSGCDAVFEADYDLPSIEEHAEAMWANKHLPNVGPTIENAPINVSDKLGRMLNELEKAHIYIAQINERNKTIEQENQLLKDRLAKIEAKLQ